MRRTRRRAGHPRRGRRRRAAQPGRRIGGLRLPVDQGGVRAGRDGGARRGAARSSPATCPCCARCSATRSAMRPHRTTFAEALGRRRSRAARRMPTGRALAESLTWEACREAPRRVLRRPSRCRREVVAIHVAPGRRLPVNRSMRRGEAGKGSNRRSLPRRRKHAHVTARVAAAVGSGGAQGSADAGFRLRGDAPQRHRDTRT